jgi:ribosomal protein L34E
MKKSGRRGERNMKGTKHCKNCKKIIDGVNAWMEEFYEWSSSDKDAQLYPEFLALKRILK